MLNQRKEWNRSTSKLYGPLSILHHSVRNGHSDLGPWSFSYWFPIAIDVPNGVLIIYLSWKNSASTSPWGGEFKDSWSQRENILAHLCTKWFTSHVNMRSRTMKSHFQHRFKEINTNFSCSIHQLYSLVFRAFKRSLKLWNSACELMQVLKNLFLSSGLPQKYLLDLAHQLKATFQGAKAAQSKVGHVRKRVFSTR